MGNRKERLEKILREARNNINGPIDVIRICPRTKENTYAQPRKDSLTERERGKIYRQCHGISKQYGLNKDRREYMKREWGKYSMRDLSDDELLSLYEYMRSLEAGIQSPR